MKIFEKLTSNKWQARMIIIIFVVVAIAAAVQLFGETEIVVEDGRNKLQRRLFGRNLKLVTPQAPKPKPVTGKPAAQ